MRASDDPADDIREALHRLESERDEYRKIADKFEGVDLDGLRNQIDLLESERDELKEQVESLESEQDERINDLESLLLFVRDWFWRVTVFGLPMSDPRPVIRRLNRAFE